MEVIAKEDKKSIIKGKKYKVELISSYYKSTNFYLGIVGVAGSYKLSGFSNIDGSDIKEEEYRSEESWIHRMDKIRKVKEGDIVVCISKKLKSLTYGKYYTVNKVEYSVFDNDRVSRISLKESKLGENYFYNAWYDSFHLIPKKQQRDININEVLDDVKVAEMTNYEDPIFQEMEKENMVLNIIHRSLDYLYKTRVNASLEEIIKHRIKYDNYITMEDINKFDLNKVMKY